MIANIIVFLILAVGGGIGSSWYMIQRGSALTTRTFGPWVTWPTAGRADTDPYTRAHYMRLGTLPHPSALAQTYEARTDSTGQRLLAYCDYIVSGDDPGAVWWSLAAYTGSGQLIANPANRYSFTSADSMRQPGGRFAITLSRDVQPGNWLPTGGASNLTLIFSVYEPRARPDEAPDPVLPVIQRQVCR